MVAVALWGHTWKGRRICCYCNNIAVVFALNKGSARDQQLMHLLRALFFFCAIQHISLSAQHIAGATNDSADALSCNNLALFLSTNPQVAPQPSLIPWELLELVFNRSLLLDVSNLDQAVHGYLKGCVATSTLASYKSTQRHYLTICQVAAIRVPFPLREDTLCRYAAYLGQQSLKHRTIKAYMSALRFGQIHRGMGDPFRNALTGVCVGRN